MLETKNLKYSKGAYLSPMSRNSAEVFFGVEKEVTNKIGRCDPSVGGNVEGWT
jgi:hypothetical protein